MCGVEAQCTGFGVHGVVGMAHAGLRVKGLGFGVVVTGYDTCGVLDPGSTVWCDDACRV